MDEKKAVFLFCKALRDRKGRTEVFSSVQALSMS